MVSRLQRRLALRRKLHILRTMTSSRSVKKSSIIKDALLYIYMLRLKLEAIKRELSDLTAIRLEFSRLLNVQPQLPKNEVKVEKAGNGFAVKVICEKKGDNKLESILEIFEEMSLIVLHATISCNLSFSMEAIVVAQEGHPLDVKNITEAVTKAIETQSGDRGPKRCTEIPNN